ncbi:hypothetical protein BJ170DRAFT_682917 [Xylariales sp. AK1849]|nr:hypothetical protein BJ170DRAFT_682917 [Xylariales sp. AK1849]
MSEAAKIPLVDIAAEGVDESDIARELVDAACTFGFVYIKNTGKHIPVDQLCNVWEISKTLFRSPLEEKQRCTIGKNNRGWTGMHAETLDPKLQKASTPSPFVDDSHANSEQQGDFKECFNFGEFVNGKAEQPIPSTVTALEPQIAEFRDSCHNLCRRLMHLFGIGLDVKPPDFFARAHAADKGPSGTTLRMLYYPPPGPTSSADAADFRAGAHSDYGSLTLLFRLAGQAGLEVLTPESHWAPVPVVPAGTENDPAPPILINIGDLLSYWTNGLLRSTLHRVVFSDATVSGESTRDPRYSIAFFCHPSRETALTHVPSEKVRSFIGGTQRERKAAMANPYAERSVMTAAEHLDLRLRDTYLAGFEETREVAAA